MRGVTVSREKGKEKERERERGSERKQMKETLVKLRRDTVSFTVLDCSHTYARVQTHTRTHTPRHACTRAHTQARTHTRTLSATPTSLRVRRSASQVVHSALGSAFLGSRTSQNQHAEPLQSSAAAPASSKVAGGTGGGR